MYTAMLTVENIHGAHHDIWSVNVEEEYHEVDDTRTGDGADQKGAKGAEGGAQGAHDGGAGAGGPDGMLRSSPAAPAGG